MKCPSSAGFQIATPSAVPATSPGVPVCIRTRVRIVYVKLECKETFHDAVVMRVQQSRLLCSQTQFDQREGAVRRTSRACRSLGDDSTARATGQIFRGSDRPDRCSSEKVTCAIHAAVILARRAFQPYVGVIRYGTSSVAQAKESSDLNPFWLSSISSALSIKSR